MKATRFSLQCRMAICCVSLLSPLVTMKTLMAWASIPSGTPITTTSPTPFNSCRVFSISLGLTRSLPVFIKSSLLATKYRYPSLSLRNKSPVYRSVSPVITLVPSNFILEPLRHEEREGVSCLVFSYFGYFHGTHGELGRRYFCYFASRWDLTMETNSPAFATRSAA